MIGCPHGAEDLRFHMVGCQKYRGYVRIEKHMERALTTK